MKVKSMLNFAPLEKTVLWPGSMLKLQLAWMDESDWRKAALDHAARLESCDDATTTEKQFAAALREVASQ